MQILGGLERKIYMGDGMNKSCGGRALRSRTIFALEELLVALFALEELLGKLTMHLSFYFLYQRFFFSSPFGCLGLCVIAWS